MLPHRKEIAMYVSSFEIHDGALMQFQVKLMIVDDSVGIAGNGNQGISSSYRWD